MKKLILRTLVAVLALPIWFTAGIVVVHAQETTCPEPTPVTIDIKPGDPSNTIHLSARGFLPVAVLTTPDFNARQFVPEMAHLNDSRVAMEMGCSGPEAVHWSY